MGKASRKRKAHRLDASPLRADVERASTAPPRTTESGGTPTSGVAPVSLFSGGARWITVTLIIANLVIYAPVRRYPFINSDDPVYVTRNANVLRGLSWPSVQWAFTDAKVPYWHPLTFLSHMLDVQIFGANAGGHHATNVVLHIASTVLLFGLFWQMTGALGRSAVVAGLFALHPLRVESVAWVAERKDVLSTFFWIATTWAYVRYAKGPSSGRYAAVLVLFALGLMAKPMIVTLPFALLLLDYWPLARVNLDGTPAGRRGASIGGLLKEKVPLFGLALFASLVTFATQRAVGAVNSLDAIPLGLRVFNSLNSYVAYIGDLLWPVGLAAVYPYPETVVVERLVTAIVLLAALTVPVLVLRRRCPYLLVGWLWYLGTLLPVIGLIQVGPTARADRFTYVPHIGLLIMLAWGIPDLLRRLPNRRVVLASLATAALVACTVVARRQVGFWRDSVTLWEHAVGVTSDNGVAYYNLGAVLYGRGRNDDAIGHLRDAVRLLPDYPAAHNQLALALDRGGDAPGATEHLADVVRLTPSSAAAHANLAVSLAKEGKNAAAIEAFSQAVLLDPSDVASRRRREFLQRGGTVKSTPPSRP